MEKFVYCVSCHAGHEHLLKQDLHRHLPGAVVYYPLLERQERKDGRWYSKSYPLLPGYLFVYVDEAVAPSRFLSIRRVNRLLGYGNAAGLNEEKGGEYSYALAGADLHFAQWIFRHGGHVGLSQAALIGGRVSIVKGPLKHYEGLIKRMDKHRRSALITISIGDTERDVWMSFEWVKPEAASLALDIPQ